MKKPKFAVGQKVRFVGNPARTNVSGRFTVERSMPETQGEIQYRIKSEFDGHVRMVMEYEIA